MQGTAAISDEETYNIIKKHKSTSKRLNKLESSPEFDVNFENSSGVNTQYAELKDPVGSDGGIAKRVSLFGKNKNLVL